MRTLAIAFLLLFVGFAWAQSQEIKKPVPPITGEAKGANKTHDETEKKKSDSNNIPAITNMIVSGKLQIESEANNKETDAESTDWTDPISILTGLLVFVTSVLAFFTYKLWESTSNLAIDARNASIKQATDMKVSLDIARASADAAKISADAAVISSMPVLSPLIGDDSYLHPMKDPADVLYGKDKIYAFESMVDFIFENFGKTPGIIRELRANLSICKRSELPNIVEFRELQTVDYHPIIAGDARGAHKMMGSVSCIQDFELTSTAFDELLAKDSDNQIFRRIHLIGQVIYDDFFGNRHTRRFCIMMVKLEDGTVFQSIRGGRAYNHVDRQPTPKDDPL